MRADPTFWIVARSSGLVAYGLLTASVLAGLVLKSRALGASPKPSAVTDLHRFLALLGLAATGLHGGALVLDRTVPISVSDLLLPGAAPYRPLATGLGVLAAELTVVVYFSFALRKRIGIRAWRRLHWVTYGVFALATVHGLAAGTDSARTWALVVYGAATGAVVAATAWRALVPPARAARPAEARRRRLAAESRPAAP